MSDISIRANKTGLSVYLLDLKIGGGRTEDKALDEAVETLGNYVATCQEALEMLDADREMGNSPDLQTLMGCSPLDLYRVGDGLEVRRGSYSLSRVKGGVTAYNIRQVLEGALRLTKNALDDCLRRIPA